MTENTLFPGRFHYTGPTRGMFILLHHTLIAEYSNNVFERVNYVRAEKDANELDTRLKCMMYVPTSNLPTEIKVLVAQANADYRYSYRFTIEMLARKNKRFFEAIAIKHIPDLPWNGYQIDFGHEHEYKSQWGRMKRKFKVWSEIKQNEIRDWWHETTGR